MASSDPHGLTRYSRIACIPSSSAAATAADSRRVGVLPPDIDILNIIRDTEALMRATRANCDLSLERSVLRTAEARRERKEAARQRRRELAAELSK